MSVKIVGIGACVMDTLITVPYYPTEDTKLRATGSKIAGGGPTASGIVAASKLGESSGFIGVLWKTKKLLFPKQKRTSYQ